MTCVDVPKPGKPVDIFTPANVLDGCATSPDVDDWLLVVDWVVQRMDQVLLIGLYESCGV
jgi:hypothetical protein